MPDHGSGSGRCLLQNKTLREMCHHPEKHKSPLENQTNPEKSLSSRDSGCEASPSPRNPERSKKSEQNKATELPLASGLRLALKAPHSVINGRLEGSGFPDPWGGSTNWVYWDGGGRTGSSGMEKAALTGHTGTEKAALCRLHRASLPLCLAQISAADRGVLGQPAMISLLRMGEGGPGPGRTLLI